MKTATAPNVARRRGDHDDGKVAFVELFFDLVFVFAITQISHLLLHHLSLRGSLESLIVLLAVWWCWIYTTWALNWLDPNTKIVRIALFALMLLGIFMSMAIPAAFAERGLVFVAAYLAAQIGRSLFTAWAMRGANPRIAQGFVRIALWMALGSIFWIAGAFAHHDMRLILWALGLGVEMYAPTVGYFVPGLGRLDIKDWTISGAHMAERCGLFVIICLGESFLITGSVFAEQAWGAANTAAFLCAFVGTVAMWWIYFHHGHAKAAHKIETSSNPASIGRLAFTFLHMPIVAGMVVAAVGDELAVVHPTGHLEVGTLATILAGPALFLIGNLAFKWSIWGRAPLSHMIGLALLALVAALGAHQEPLTIALGATGALILTALWEHFALREEDHA